MGIEDPEHRGSLQCGGERGSGSTAEFGADEATEIIRVSMGDMVKPSPRTRIWSFSVMDSGFETGFGEEEWLMRRSSRCDGHACAHAFLQKNVDFWCTCDTCRNPFVVVLHD